MNVNMKDENSNAKIEMLKLIFKTSCETKADDKYRRIRGYIVENKIGLDEAICTLKDDDSFSTDEFEDSIFKYSKPDNPDLLF